VVPVPTFIERKQIGVVDPKNNRSSGSLYAPRLVEYHDDDPCRPQVMMTASAMPMLPVARSVQDAAVQKKYGVTIEASYDVGEYDVLILSANESNGLVNWLTDNKYRFRKG